MDSPLSGGPSKGLHRYGFKVVRKRRATVQETSSKHAHWRALFGVQFTKARGVTFTSWRANGFCTTIPTKRKTNDWTRLRPSGKLVILMSHNYRSYIWVVQILMSHFRRTIWYLRQTMKFLRRFLKPPIVTDLIKRRPTNLSGNDRRPSALISRRNQSRNHKLGEWPVSYRTK